MFYENYTQAELEIPDFSSVGIMHFEKNFSLALEERIKDPLNMPDNLISISQIHVGLYNPSMLTKIIQFYFFQNRVIILNNYLINIFNFF